MNTSPTPPQWADRFLSWFCKPALLEMIQGDLHEQFCQMVEDQVPRVRWRYGWEVVRLCRPPIIRRNLFESSTTSIAMWKNYFQIAWRNLLKQKGYSLINLGGLTLGILCFLFLYAYIRHEDSYDTFHEKGDRIMQGYWNAYWDGESQVIGVTPTALLPTLMEKFPEVETGVRLYRPSTTTFPAVVQKGDTQFEEVGFTYADSTFFDVFSFELLQGNPKTALAEPNSLVLSTESAFKYFGTTNVLGEELVVNGTPYAITGVVLDAPSNTNVDYSILASFSSHRKSQQHSWWSASLFTYVVLRPGAHLPDVLEKLNGIVEDAVGDNLSGDDRLEYSMFPLQSVHLDAPTMQVLVPQGNRASLRILLAISLLVLVIACINYMNLTTARSIFRAREVGVRKVMGALKGSIFRQFMSEAFLLTVFSMALAVGAMFLLYPQFLRLAGAQIEQPFTQDMAFWYYLLIIGLVVTFLAGSYPALVLANFKPLQVLRGSFRGSLSGQALRKGLVVVQFAISAVLIFGTITITRQLDFLKSTPLGYNQDQVISIPMPKAARQDRLAVSEQLKAIAGVKTVAASTHPPHEILGGYSIWVEGMDKDRSMSVVASAIENNFLETTGIQLVAGRNITMQEVVRSREENEEGNTPTPILVNEAAVKKLGETNESILGKEANINGRVGPIVGVVSDFHFRSLHEEVEPLALFSEEWQLHHLLIRLDGDDVNQTLADLNTQWSQISPERPFGYKFLDESYAAMYQKEERLGKIITMFSSITIFIACLGLFGLASFTTVQRSKEVAVRRVLGASGSQVVILLGRQFLILMAIALLIALPVSYYFSAQWLESFAYRITPGVGIALTASFAVIGLGMFTVSFESIKAALANPIKNLRSE